MKLKFWTFAWKTAKNFRGLLFCRTLYTVFWTLQLYLLIHFLNWTFIWGPHSLPNNSGLLFWPTLYGWCYFIQVCML